MFKGNTKNCRRPLILIPEQGVQTLSKANFFKNSAEKEVVQFSRQTEVQFTATGVHVKHL